MASLREWMSQTHPEAARQIGIPEDSTRLQIYTALLVIGGPNPGGYGIIEGGGLLGRIGLTQEEFFMYQQLSNFVIGWLEGTDYAEIEWFKQAQRDELQRLRDLHEAPKPPLSP